MLNKSVVQKQWFAAILNKIRGKCWNVRPDPKRSVSAIA